MHSPLATPKATIETLQAFGLYTKKRLGQHFLIDDNVIGRILEAADLAESDHILEIGPGIGVLTVALLQQLEQLAGAGKVLALEYDQQLIEVLESTTQSEHPPSFLSVAKDLALDAGSHPYIPSEHPRLTILNEDALNIPQLEVLQEFAPTKLVANLPYQVAATNVLDCFEYLPSMRQATVMVQREVAQRMAAGPGTKVYGAYSAKLQLLADPVDIFAVSRNSFLPPPRVDSSVITLRRRDEADLLVTDIEHYRRVAAVIDACFAQRRKTIYNNLRSKENSAGIMDALRQADIDPQVRAEMLAPCDFVRLESFL